MPYVRICDVCNKEVLQNEGCSTEKTIPVTLPSGTAVKVSVNVRQGLVGVVFHEKCFHVALRIAADNITPDGHI